MKKMPLLPALLAFLLLPRPGAAQSYDLLGPGWGDERTFRLTRAGIPSTFMGGDTVSQFTEFDGTVLIRSEEHATPDGSAIIHGLELRKRGVETIRTSRRIVSQHMVDVATRDTIIETVGDGEGAGTNSLRGWMFPDTVWNSPPCPDIPDTALLYPYARMYRYYSPTPADSMDERDGYLHLRTLWTDCLDNAVSRELLVSRHGGLHEIRLYTFNFFDWSSDERYILTATPAVDKPEAPPYGIHLSCYPNPSSADAVIHVDAVEITSLRLFVHDVQGRVLRILHDGRLGTGVHDIRFDTRGLANGQYYCTALTERSMRTIPLVVLRKQ